MTKIFCSCCFWIEKLVRESTSTQWRQCWWSLEFTPFPTYPDWEMGWFWMVKQLHTPSYVVCSYTFCWNFKKRKRLPSWCLQPHSYFDPVALIPIVLAWSAGLSFSLLPAHGYSELLLTFGKFLLERSEECLTQSITIVFWGLTRLAFLICL